MKLSAYLVEARRKAKEVAATEEHLSSPSFLKSGNGKARIDTSHLLQVLQRHDALSKSDIGFKIMMKMHG